MKHDFVYYDATKETFMCVLCGCTEKYLTTHCRGLELDRVMLLMIAMGQADYVDGAWIRPHIELDLRFK